MLCVWDLTTGACVYSIQAHDGAVLSLAYSPSYVVSMGSDEKLCVWERFHGHLINTINLVSNKEFSKFILTTSTLKNIIVCNKRKINKNHTFSV